MSDTSAQLSDALTAEFVAFRGLIEAMINRVTHIVAQEQAARLEIQEHLDRLIAEIAALREAVTTLQAEARERSAQLAALEQYVYALGERRT